MEEPQLISMHDFIKKEPIQLRLFPLEEYEYEDNTENSSQSIPELESNEID
jgi:hypothetical protein